MYVSIEFVFACLNIYHRVRTTKSELCGSTKPSTLLTSDIQTIETVMMSCLDNFVSPSKHSYENMNSRTWSASHEKTWVLAPCRFAGIPTPYFIAIQWIQFTAVTSVLMLFQTLILR